MKKLLCLLFLCAPVFCAAALPLGPQGKAEAALYMDFLRAALVEASDDAQACNYYKQALSRAPQSKYLRRILVVCSLADGKTDEAARYAGYIDVGENDGEDLAVYAFYKWRTGDLKEAQDYYERALEKSPDDLRVLYQYVLLLSYLDVDRAAEKLASHKANYPGLAHVIDYETGNIYRSKKQFEKALEYYNKATSENPEYPEPYLARAEMYEKTSQFFLMLRELELLEKTGYESAAMYSRMGSVFVIVKDEEKARDYFLKAKALDGTDIPAGYFLALFAEGRGDYAAAAQYLRETADYPQDAGKWLQTAFYQQRGEDAPGALKTLKEAYKRFDKNVEIGYFYALALQDAKEYRASARVLKGVLQTNPKYENARLAYAFALEGAKRYKQMEEQLRLLLEQNPGNAAAYNLLGFSLAERGIRLDEAQELVTKALEINPDDRAFVDSLAWVYYRKGQYAKALELLQSLDDGFVRANADVAYHLGAVYAALGQARRARPYLELSAPQTKDAARLLKKLPARTD